MKGLQQIMKTHMLRGKIESLVLVDVLSHVSRSKETGILNVVRGSVQKSVIIHEGHIVFARSNQRIDRLGDMLLSQGKITQEQYDSASVLLREKGYRHGRSLVEIGAISPRQLWQAIQHQIKMIAYSVLPFEEGTFEFVRQEIKQKEQITLELPVMDLLIDMIRHYDDRAIFQKKFSDLDVVLEAVPEDERTEFKLEPYEDYVFKKVDGETSLRDLCEDSDLGPDESLRIIFLLRTLGWVRSALPSDEVDSGPYGAMLKKYNEMYRYLNGYLKEHLGNVGRSIMGKYFEETTPLHESILGGVRMSSDGSLDQARILANLEASTMAEEQGRMALDEALNEFLYACILAIKKALGTEHETRVVSHLETMQG